MRALRTFRLLHRLVLAWFVLSLGVAVAAPLLHPVSIEMVCTTAGAVKAIATDADGDAVELGHHTLDCALCFAGGHVPPPEVVALQLPAPDGLAHAMQPVPAARIAALTAAPLPARGPPGLL